jgi:hypothetical protein
MWQWGAVMTVCFHSSLKINCSRPTLELVNTIKLLLTYKTKQMLKKDKLTV